MSDMRRDRVAVDERRRFFAVVLRRILEYVYRAGRAGLGMVSDAKVGMADVGQLLPKKTDRNAAGW